jgi:hypothetical protein
MPNHQNAIAALMSGTSEMHSPLRMQERQASLLDEDTPGIREFHNPSLIASEQVKSMLFFEIGNLFAERRLGDVQSVRGPREVPLFGQDNDCVQVTDFEVGEHCSKPQAVDTSRFVPRGRYSLIDFHTGMIVFLVGGPDSGQKIRKGLDLKVRDEGPALRDGQLFKHLSSFGRSSETARMQDWPSNWILSAE